jgi:hypothetical protein
MIEVESSTIKKIGYSYPDKKLIVEFKSGGIYHYKEVPEEIFEELKTCESIGKFLNENIHNLTLLDHYPIRADIMHYLHHHSHML